MWHSSPDLKKKKVQNWTVCVCVNIHLKDRPFLNSFLHLILKKNDQNWVRPISQRLNIYAGLYFGHTLIIITWCLSSYLYFLRELPHRLLHAPKLAVHALSDLLQRISHLYKHTVKKRADKICYLTNKHRAYRYDCVMTLCVAPPLTSLMYFISSRRWLTVHSRGITCCCLSGLLLCTRPYNLGLWCCSEGSGCPLVMSPRCWGRQDRTAQVSFSWADHCVCVCVRVLGWRAHNDKPFDRLFHNFEVKIHSYALCRH